MGRAIVEAIDAGEARRDEMVVCTKGGYVASMARRRRRARRTTRGSSASCSRRASFARDDLVRGGHSHRADDSWRTSSRGAGANLGLHAIDLYYLHNPEEQLLGVDRATFATRLRAAFVLLEERAERGRDRGLWMRDVARACAWRRSTGSISRSPSWSRWRARSGARRHHFRAVQLPVSLAMPEAARCRRSRSAASWCRCSKLRTRSASAVVASAPLMQGRLADGLPGRDARRCFRDAATDAQRALRFASSLPGVARVLAGMRRRRTWRRTSTRGDGAPERTPDHDLDDDERLGSAVEPMSTTAMRCALVSAT